MRPLQGFGPTQPMSGPLKLVTSQAQEGPECGRNPLVGVKRVSLTSRVHTSDTPSITWYFRGHFAQTGQGVGGITPSELTHMPPPKVDFCAYMTHEEWG